jgi:glycosyltransferase involved in cell wall biosynthesis
MTESKPNSCWVVTPTYNDHPSTLKLLKEISELKGVGVFNVLVVDDASTTFNAEYFVVKNFEARGAIVNYFFHELENNLGNQGAIVAGLRKVQNLSSPDQLIIVMDSDGEDRPQDIPKLVNAYKNGEIVVAQRAKQKSNLTLMLWHNLFKFILKLLINKNLNFGNFSLIDGKTCMKLLTNKRIDLSYVGCVLQSGFNLNRVKLNRGQRYFGNSKTNRDGLLIWGFLILSVFSEKIFAKLLRLGVILGLLCFLGFLGFITLGLFTDISVPGWSGLMIALLTLTMIQVIVMLSGFLVLQSQIRTK